MDTALQYDRLQFAVTATFHYLFPQLTMGLALLLVYLRTRDLFEEGDHFHHAARFWTGLFALSFAFGVVTGIPLEFQFGTNWSRFSEYAGGIVGQTLAMEGVFAFFLESSFLGLLLFGWSRVSRRTLWLVTVLLFLGSWLSGYFILATNAWMQHPVAYQVAADGSLTVDSLAGLLTNPWLIWQFAHNMTAAVATGAFVMAAVGALYQLAGLHLGQAQTYLRTGVVAGALASLLLITPTGHENARQVFEFQPVKGAAFEGLFRTERGADLVLIGQPNMETMTIDNPLVVPSALSLLVYDDLYAKVKGLDAFPPQDWPDHIALLYYAYHIMVGLGTILLAVTGLALVWLWRGTLFRARWLLWLLLLSAPLPYLATTAGWMTAELGRQPWLVYGLYRTAEGISPLVHSGNALFTLLGFLGIYLVLGLLFVLLFVETLRHGPTEPAAAPTGG
ncbi:cytochrome ubiquinol oxidase subunit I [Nitrospirales bacterium NOB]|nr:MAG: cytochrome bd oxidase subunit I [Nitrospira sp. OLB3]MBV6470575.1 Cytochrome bd-I ubiquinol oxidase subunit 1 [Nitrospirota bacterium]MCE7965395.1 cytochrome ubiquinol oxidase subunit I [Nitrospira sp. NTP2]MDL1889789.1 cytochrome ubiquinol oxidase subunit I [Nitrospirales bacterium NOB]QOJ37234.1 MAG: cytochrome ubiquinol oxidase subunit I [Nitrospira sp.]